MSLTSTTYERVDDTIIAVDDVIQLKVAHQTKSNANDKTLCVIGPLQVLMAITMLIRLLLL